MDHAADLPGHCRRREPGAACGNQRSPAQAGGACCGTGLRDRCGWRHAVAGPNILARDGRLYVVTEATEIPELGAINVPVRSLDVGESGNAPAGLQGIWQLAPSGLDSDAEIVEMRGGTERESPASLLERLLFLIRRPPAGGNRYDYIRWAREVPGVAQAYVYPLRRGLGTVDVVVTSDTGLPSAETLGAVQSHIDALRPVTAKNFVVLAPTIVDVDVHVQIRRAGVTLLAAQAAVEGVLLAQFAALAPGVTWIRSQAEGQISALAGIVDRVVVSPVANVIPTVDADAVEWLRAGDLLIEDMA